MWRTSLFGLVARWPGVLLQRRDVPGILFAILIVAGILFGYLYRPFSGRALWYLNSGPGWTCEYPSSGEPICIKDVPHKDAP